MSSNKKPNFFILGAPKCGTTAMSEYLRTHPDVCFSRPKETYFLNTDFSDKSRNTKTWDEYLQCFNHCKGEKMIGEGTVYYLYSNQAVPNILNFNPQAMFVVMVRNPIDMAYSWHGQTSYFFQESVKDFEKAWRLQKKRAENSKLPLLCEEPKMLQYGPICKTGEQLKRLYEQVPREQVHVIVFDDFVKDTRSEYLKLLDFLELEDDGRTEFTRINPNQEVNRALKLILEKPTNLIYSIVKPVSKKIKKWLGVNNWGLLDKLTRKKEVDRKPLDPEFREELKDYFREDVELLSELLDRDLTYWVEPEPVDSTGEAV